MAARQQLTRSDSDRVIAGVAAGLAHYFGVDPTLIRVVWVLSVFFGGFGILAYVVLWIALPAGPVRTPAIRLAEERFARGEISAEELERIRADLRAGRRYARGEITREEFLERGEVLTRSGAPG